MSAIMHAWIKQQACLHVKLNVNIDQKLSFYASDTNKIHFTNAPPVSNSGTVGILRTVCSFVHCNLLLNSMEFTAVRIDNGMAFHGRYVTAMCPQSRPRCIGLFTGPYKSEVCIIRSHLKLAFPTPPSNLSSSNCLRFVPISHGIFP